MALRIPIRWKLACSAIVPLAIVAVAVGLLVYRALVLRSTEEFESRSGRLNDALVARLDAKLIRSAQVAECVSAIVATLPELDQAQLERVLAAAVAQEPLIYGAAIAFEPGRFDPRRRLVAPYVHRRGDGLRTIDIGADSYDYTDPRWSWYAVPRETGRPAWSEPYYDDGAGDLLMCTYSVPIRRAGEIVGVATVDIPLVELPERIGIDDEHGRDFFVLSGSGAFIAAPDPGLLRGATLAELATKRGCDDLARLAQLMLAGRRGIVRADGIAPGDSCWYFFGPVPSSGWSLAVVVPESSLRDGARSEFAQSVPTLGLALLAVTGCVWVAARRVTRPIDQLSAAVKSIAAGRLDVDLPRVRRGDEVGDLADTVDRLVAELRGKVEGSVADRVERESPKGRRG